MKVICVHHRLAGYSSHHVNEAHGLTREFRRRGREVVLLVNAQASASIVSELNARAVIEDPTFRMEWSFEERSKRFRDILHKHVDGLLKAGDLVLLTVATQLEAYALTLWLQEVPRRKKPWIVILFISDRWNRAGSDEYERQIVEFRKLEAALSCLTPEHANRLVFCAITDLLAEELSGLLGTRPHVVPIPLPFGEIPSFGSTRTDSLRPRVAILGGTRREKGSHLIPEIIRACRALVPVEFIVQLTNNTLTASEVKALGRIADEPEVSVIHDALPPAAYESVLNGADIGLFPYEVVPYRKRISGVFAEAVAYGKPVVVTPGTWMAEQIDAGRAAGTIAEDLQPTSIAQAIARCVANLEPLRKAAQAASAGWRSSDLSAFVDFIEQEVATRSQTESPPRRSFWPF